MGLFSSIGNLFDGKPWKPEDCGWKSPPLTQEGNKLDEPQIPQRLYEEYMGGSNESDFMDRLEHASIAGASVTNGTYPIIKMMEEARERELRADPKNADFFRAWDAERPMREALQKNTDEGFYGGLALICFSPILILIALLAIAVVIGN